MQIYFILFCFLFFLLHNKKCVYVNKKINMNLLFLFIDARVRIQLLIQIYFLVFSLKIKNMHAKIK
jgi:hypothetical protein